MSDTPQHETTHRHVDHGFGDVDPRFVVPDQSPPTDHPPERALDDPAAREDLEAGFMIGSADHLHDEVEKPRLVHQLTAIVGAVGEEVLQPRPTLADRIEDHLRTRTVGYVGGRQVDHEEPPIGIHRDVAFPPDDLLAGVVAALFRVGRLHRLAVDDAAGRARFSSASFPVDHQRDVVDRPEQKLADEAAEPPVNGLPPRKVTWQHSPPAPGSAEVPDGVENLPKVDHTSSACLSRSRQQGYDQ